MNSDYQYSLCYTEQGFVGEFRTYRVADYDRTYRRFKEVDYTRDTSPMRIYRSPVADIRENTTHFLKWEIVDTETGKHHSHTTPELNHEEIFEIYFCPEIDIKNNITDEEIRSVLKSGITINAEVNEKFLLGIGFQNKKYFILILLEKSNFIYESGIYKLNKQISDVINVRHFVDKYSISVLDKVSNRTLLENSNRGAKYPERNFYKYTYLPEVIGNFRLHTSQEYASVYISRYLKRYKNRYMITNANVNVIKVILEESLADYSLLNQLEYDIGSGGLTEKIRSKLNDVLVTLNIENELEGLVNNHLLKDKEIKEKYLKLIQEEWERQTITQLEDAEKQIKETNDNLKALNVEKETLEESINERKENIRNETMMLTEEKKEILREYDSEISNKGKILQEINSEIKNNLLDYKFQMMNIATNSGITLGVEDSRNSQLIEPYPGFISNESFEAEESIAHSVEAPLEIKDYADDLEDNLSVFFQVNQRRDIIYTFISAVWMGMNFVTNSNCGFNLAKSVSLMIDECVPLSIYLSDTNTDSKKMMDLINESKSTVVYIDGVFDLYNEALLSLLCQNCKEKIIIFGIGDKYSLKEMSNHLWFHLIYIDLEKIMNFSEDQTLEKFTFLLNKFKPVKKFVDKNSEFKILEKNGLISRSQRIQLSNIQYYYHNIASEVGISKLLIEQIYIMNTHKFDKKQQIDELMVASKVSLSKLPSDDMKVWFKENE